MKENREIFGFPCRGTKAQLDEMYNLLNYEDYTKPKFGKYFYRWVTGTNSGLMWYPRPEYCSIKGDDYVLALFRASGNQAPYRSVYAAQYRNKKKELV